MNLYIVRSEEGIEGGMAGAIRISGLSPQAFQELVEGIESAIQRAVFEHEGVVHRVATGEVAPPQIG